MLLESWANKKIKIKKQHTKITKPKYGLNNTQESLPEVHIENVGVYPAELHDDKLRVRMVADLEVLDGGLAGPAVVVEDVWVERGVPLSLLTT